MRLITSASSAAGSGFLAHPEGWGHMGGWGWPIAAVGLLSMALVLGAVVWLTLTLTRRRPDASNPRVVGARDILDERYARGEIGRDEYLERKADLES